MENLQFQKVSVRQLPYVQAPVPPGGGRLQSAAGELAQIVNGQTYQFLAYLEFKPDDRARRGNHMHVRKTEVLYVVSGSLRGVYRDLDTGETMEIILASGDLVTIQPNCAHSYVALTYSQAIEIGDEPYDATDTIPYDFGTM